MAFQALPFRSDLRDYEKQAADLFAGWKAGDAPAIAVFKSRHPRFLDDKIPWLQKDVSDDDVKASPLTIADARLAVARWYDYQDWSRLGEHVSAIEAGGPIARFEGAVEALIDGDAASLSHLLAGDPGLVRARSTRVNYFDPPQHRATVLHYIAANGVEGYRQRSPKNAVEVARVLLDAGADPNALASMYGSECTTMSMLVSSTPPDEAGVQVPLVDVLVDYGASVEPMGQGTWTSPLVTAIVFGFSDAAAALVRRGARVDTVAAAAGLGRLEDVQRLLPASTADDRHRGLALAAQMGHTDVVRLLLDAGEDPNRFNPNGTHAHTPPIHQAIARGHLDVVKLLVERGARLDIKDTLHHGTPLGWARYMGKKDIEQFLAARA